MTAVAEDTALSREYETPMGLAHTTMQALKDRIKLHYDLASDYYLSLWGEHIHHGYWPTDASKASESKEVAQTNLIQLLLQIAELPAAADAPLRVLDVGCGVGGTSRYLAEHLGAQVTGITISTRQVELATKLAKAGPASSASSAGAHGTAEAANEAKTEALAGTGADTPFVPFGKGAVRFIELDAETMGDFFAGDAGAGAFDVVWISEALSHFPDKALFFRNAARVLRPNTGKLVLADWFKDVDLPAATFDADIKPIEDGMLLPPLSTQVEYVQLAVEAGLAVHAAPKDISADVRQTWDLTWSLVQKPSLWAFALSQGRDGIAFLQAFRAMRRGYANGSFRYAVMCFSK